MIGLAFALVATVWQVNAAAAGNATAAHSTQFRLVTSAKDVQFLGEHQLQGGDYTASWRMFGGEVVTVAGAPGSTVTVPAVVTSAGVSAAGVTLTAPNMKTKGAALAKLAADYAKAGKSPEQDALAVGFTPTDAAKLGSASSGAMSPSAVTPMTASGTIIYSGCANVTGDAGNAWGKACDVQKMLQDNGGGDWYVGDEVTGSGNDNDWADSLSGLAGYVSYGSGNTIVKYAPNATKTVGSCTNVTESLSYDGVGLSASTDVCPDRMDPYGLPSSTKFGSKWSGCDGNAWTEGVDSDDAVHSPPSAASSPNVSVTIWWSFC